eukprot:2529222-Amphidinium_carterae.1
MSMLKLEVKLGKSFKDNVCGKRCQFGYGVAEVKLVKNSFMQKPAPAEPAKDACWAQVSFISSVHKCQHRHHGLQAFLRSEVSNSVATAL